MKKILILFVVMSVACAAKLPPTQDEAQAVLNSAVASANEATADWFWRPTSGEGRSRITVWKAASLDEIRMLSSYFRLELPSPNTELINGEEILSYPFFRTNQRTGFIITLRKDNAVLLSFIFVDGSHIDAKELHENSSIKVDNKSADPFYARLLEAAKQNADILVDTPSS